MKLIVNKKLHLTHAILETYEAGMQLFGFEVKSLRNKLGSLEGGKVLVRGGEAFLVGIYIPPYQQANAPKSYDPYRTRKLLFHKKELTDLYIHDSTKTLTLHPVSLYSKNNLLKCEVAVCKKKSTRDKREDLKKEITKRELRDF